MSRSWSGPCGQPCSKYSSRGNFFLSSSKWSSGSWLFGGGAADGAWGRFLSSSHPLASIASIWTQHVLPHCWLKRSCKSISLSLIYVILQNCWWFTMCWVFVLRRCYPCNFNAWVWWFVIGCFTKCPTLSPMHPETCRFVTPTCMHVLKIAGWSMEGCDLRQPHSWL